MIALECGVDTKNALRSTSTLNVVQKDGNYRYLSTQKLCQQILVKKYFIYPVFACRFDGTNYLIGMYIFGLRSDYSFITRKDYI